jgi:hypothetical protein
MMTMSIPFVLFYALQNVEGEMIKKLRTACRLTVLMIYCESCTALLALFLLMMAC